MSYSLNKLPVYCPIISPRTGSLQNPLLNPLQEVWTTAQTVAAFSALTESLCHSLEWNFPKLMKLKCFPNKREAHGKTITIARAPVVGTPTLNPKPCDVKRSTTTVGGRILILILLGVHNTSQAYYTDAGQCFYPR